MTPAELSPSGQSLPEEIELPERAHDIQGRVFGALTALRPVDKNQRGVLWLCECECGRHAIRTTARLQQAKKNNVESQCATCQRELYRGVLSVRADFWREFYLLHWYEHGSLYTERQLDAIEDHITEDLREMDFPVGEPLPDTSDGNGIVQPERYYEMICDEPGQTLKEIGLVFGVNRERVRQICLIAMNKLLRKHRRLLTSLFTGEFDWRAVTLEAPPEFTGCGCKRYERSAPGHIYCRSCGQVWPMDERQITGLLTKRMLQDVTIFEEEKRTCSSCGCEILATHYSSHKKRCVESSDKERASFRRNGQWPHRRQAPGDRSPCLRCGARMAWNADKKLECPFCDVD